jgi:hypothetical protein
MIDPTKLDINKLPKRFIDGAIGAHGKEGFSFVLTSGTELHSFMTTPTTMKSISEWMAKQIDTYEKQFGVIDMTPPAVVSPLQASDLGNK